MALVSSCRKKADPLPANTLAVLDPVQLIRNQDVAATSVILTSRMLSSGNESIVTIGQLCSTTNRQPTLDDQDAHWAREVRVGTLPFRFTTGVTGLQPATHYYNTSGWYKLTQAVNVNSITKAK
ncbi:hypothetical protein [Spirosoma utsteinense]|uniref:Uncharacterized protein n=1 Tax=Spirosoma utsteinense TaxID=2585773 RepID=A0ABR6WE57_9BACT|nr:hypothetical protein [Spirosoma utsteinense]MBC3788917.1 hypothetical protein [Spirosoma utsteinense]MBC3794834.1 hypothetical protein [Spirosoma utsteinense]